MVDFKKAQPLFEQVMPKTIIYGINGIGKSRLAMQAPNNIFMDFDKNLAQYKVVSNRSEGIKYPLDTFQQVLDFVTLLINEPHDFKTVIIDSASSLNMIIENQVKLEKNVDSVKAIPFDKGYDHTRVLWEQLLRKLDFLWEKRKMMIIIIAHDQLKEVKNPIDGNFHGYDVALHKDIGALLRYWSNMMLYATTLKRFTEHKGKEKFGNINKKLTESKRILYTEGDDLFVAKNTFDLPPIIPFDDVEKAWAVIYNHIKSHYEPKVAPQEGKKE